MNISGCSLLNWAIAFDVLCRFPIVYIVFYDYTGYYCDQVALLEPAGLCEAGYFCGSASTMSTQNMCPPGRFCPIGKPSSV